MAGALPAPFGAPLTSRCFMVQSNQADQRCSLRMISQLVKNGSFVPLQTDRILFDIPPMTCEKFRDECPIEKNPVLDDYRLLTKITKKKPCDSDDGYCSYLAGEIADKRVTAAIEMEYIRQQDVFKCLSEGHRMCVAQKLNTINEEKCRVKVNLTVYL